MLAGQDGGIALVDRRAGQRDFTMGGHQGRVNGIAVAEGDRLVVSGGVDGLLTARHLDLPWWQRQACVLPGRGLTAHERRLFLNGVDVSPCA